LKRIEVAGARIADVVFDYRKAGIPLPRRVQDYDRQEPQRKG
jgi:hypothetical protein